MAETKTNPNLLIKCIQSKCALFIFWISNFAYLPGFLKATGNDKYLILMMFSMSLMYHTIQIYYKNERDEHSCSKCRHCMYIDMLFATITSIYILKKNMKKIGIKIGSLILVTGFIFALHYTKKYGCGHWYLGLHTIWHLLTGFLLYYFVKEDDENYQNIDDIDEYTKKI